MPDVTSEGRCLRFAFITPCAGEAFFRPVEQGIRDAAAMLGVDYTFGGTEEVDLPAQAALIQQAVAAGFDGLAVSVPHPTALNAAIRAARDSGIPVVAFNVAAGYPANGCLSAVCQNLYQAGHTLGQLAAPAIADHSRVLMTVHSEGISALEDRLRGEQEALADKGLTWQVLTSGMEPEQACARIAAALGADPSIRAILCTGQADTEGAGLAVERHFAGQGLYVAGFDLSAEILRLVKDGVVACTIDQQPYVQGFYPLVQLALYCRYGLQPADLDAGASVVTRANADSVAQLCAAGYR